MPRFYQFIIVIFTAVMTSATITQTVVQSGQDWEDWIRFAALQQSQYMQQLLDQTAGSLVQGGHGDVCWYQAPAEICSTVLQSLQTLSSLQTMFHLLGQAMHPDLQQHLYNIFFLLFENHFSQYVLCYCLWLWLLIKWVSTIELYKKNQLL